MHEALLEYMTIITWIQPGIKPKLNKDDSNIGGQENHNNWILKYQTQMIISQDLQVNQLLQIIISPLCSTEKITKQQNWQSMYR